ncbi:hypothetical protein IL306_005272 [Fusarium sp. DS 682]|nr:hypothetical protein IL306_005272 [Fusarium sp. DS 682]
MSKESQDFGTAMGQAWKTAMGGRGGSRRGRGDGNGRGGGSGRGGRGGGVRKSRNCWNCNSPFHQRRDCPTRDRPRQGRPSRHNPPAAPPAAAPPAPAPAPAPVELPAEVPAPAPVDLSINRGLMLARVPEVTGVTLEASDTLLRAGSWVLPAAEALINTWFPGMNIPDPFLWPNVIAARRQREATMAESRQVEEVPADATPDDAAPGVDGQGDAGRS